MLKLKYCKFSSIPLMQQKSITKHLSMLMVNERSLSININRIKGFKEIPGPNPLPFIGNLWRYFPLIGHYSLERMDQNGRYNLNRYGKIVREEISDKHKIIHLFDPNDMESMFRQQPYPYRRSHRALLKYRRERPDKYQSGGIFPENGFEWARLRDLFKHYFLLPQNINIYDRQLNEIVQDLVHYIRQTRNSNTFEVDDFQQILYRWSLESICSIMLDHRIGCLDLNQKDSMNDDGMKMLNGAHKTLYAVMRTELYDSWERKETKDYRCLVEGQDFMAEVVEKYLQKRIEEIPSDENYSPETLLSKLIRNPNINRKDLFGIMMDCIFAGIDTTSITAGFTVYFLAKNIDIQKRVQAEVLNSLGNNNYFKAEHFLKTPLLKACLKETLRLRPVSIGVGRLTTEDMIIDGYHIPKDTMIITQNQVSCRLEQYYNQADRFKPERWLMMEKRLQREHKFLYIPFGQGTRMCLGRRIAELEMHILLSGLLKHFHIEYCYEDINQKTRLINIPDRPMKFRFIDR